MFDVPYDSIGELKTIFKKAKFIHSYSTGFLTQQHARSSDCCFWHSSNIKTNFTIQWILDYFVNSEKQFSMIMIFASPNKHDINVQQTLHILWNLQRMPSLTTVVLANVRDAQS